jgi:hypothetical protein
MNSDKPISVKMWLRRSQSKAAASALGFLSKYREWLQTSEVAHIAAPILTQIDAGTLLPTPALELLKTAISTYHNEKTVAEVEAKLAAKSADVAEGESNGESGAIKNWQATVYDPKGNVVIVSWETAEGIRTKALDESFNLNQRATGWADRRLFEDCSPGSYAIITHIPTGATETIQRGDAYARILRSGKRPAVRSGSKGNSLGFQTKAHQTRVSFSAG